MAIRNENVTELSFLYAETVTNGSDTFNTETVDVTDSDEVTLFYSFPGTATDFADATDFKLKLQESFDGGTTWSDVADSEVRGGIDDKNLVVDFAGAKTAPAVNTSEYRAKVGYVGGGNRVRARGTYGGSQSTNRTHNFVWVGKALMRPTPKQNG